MEYEGPEVCLELERLVLDYYWVLGSCCVDEHDSLPSGSGQLSPFQLERNWLCARLVVGSNG